MLDTVKQHFYYIYLASQFSFKAKAMTLLPFGVPSFYFKIKAFMSLFCQFQSIKSLNHKKNTGMAR